MKTLTIALVAWMTTVTAWSTNGPPFSIHYYRAGLTEILTADNTLTYITHSQKTNLVALRQDLSSYDRHQTTATLDNADRNALLAWIETNNWHDIAIPYPSGDPGSYGAAFKATLDITFSSAHHHASWDSTSECSAIREAIKELEAICSVITEKKAPDVEPTR